MASMLLVPGFLLLLLAGTVDSSGVTVAGGGFCVSSANCNGQTCNSNACLCPSGYSGANCGTDPSGVTVAGGAYCATSANCNGQPCTNNNACQCSSGYSGTNCETDPSGVTVAGGAYCLASGSCNHQTCTLYYACQCSSGYSGANCETSSTPSPSHDARSTENGTGFCVANNLACNGANGGGTCSNIDPHGIGQCVCNVNFVGRQCQTSSSGTTSGLGFCGIDTACNSANSGGTCIIDQSPFGHCQCNTGFSGTQCETGSGGTTDGLGPCLGDNGACNGANLGGTCTSDFHYAQAFSPVEFGHCLCNAGFSGTQCQTTAAGDVSGLGLCSDYSLVFISTTTGPFDFACNGANNGGYCTYDTDQWVAGYCVCNAGFTGFQCGGRFPNSIEITPHH